MLIAACGGKSGGGVTPTPDAPQISCPTDVIVTGVSAPFQTVTYTAPAVTQGAPPVTTTCSPVSGTSFPLGTTPVTCAASDAMSRRATCVFNVTLKGLKLGAMKFGAFGDSFTEGENGRRVAVLDIPNAYPTKLQAAFDATYPNQGITVINRGHSGDTASVTVDTMRKFLPVDRPDAVLILTGFNDLLTGGCKVADGQNPLCNNAIKAVDIGVRDAIRKIKESPVPNAFVFVGTLTPAGPLVPPTNPDDRRLRKDAIEQTNDRIRQGAAAGGAVLVDLYPLFGGHEAEYIDNDGLHPRPAGSQAIADAFFAAIQKTIPQTPLFGFTFPH